MQGYIQQLLSLVIFQISLLASEIQITHSVREAPMWPLCLWLRVVTPVLHLQSMFQKPVSNFYYGTRSWHMYIIYPSSVFCFVVAPLFRFQLLLPLRQHLFLTINHSLLHFVFLFHFPFKLSLLSIYSSIVGTCPIYCDISSSQ